MRGVYVSPRLIGNPEIVVNVVMWMEEEERGTGPLYVCVRCGREVYLSELERYVSFRCPECGYRIFKKARPSIVKRVKAR